MCPGSTTTTYYVVERRPSCSSKMLRYAVATSTIDISFSLARLKLRMNLYVYVDIMMNVILLCLIFCALSSSYRTFGGIFRP